MQRRPLARAMGDAPKRHKSRLYSLYLPNYNIHIIFKMEKNMNENFKDKLCRGHTERLPSEDKTKNNNRETINVILMT